jgi:hypothetical protein
MWPHGTAAKHTGRFVQVKPTTNVNDDVTSTAETQRQPDSQQVAESPSTDDVGTRREHSRSTSR